VVAMGWTNLIITGTIVASAAVLLKGDVKHSATILRRNLKHIQTWVKEEAKEVTRCARRNLALAQTSFGDHGYHPASDARGCSMPGHGWCTDARVKGRFEGPTRCCC